MIRIPPLLEKFITIFSLIFYTRLFSFESLFVHSEGELAVSSPDYTPLDPLLSLMQHGIAFVVLVLMALRWQHTIGFFRRNPFLWLLIILVLISANWSNFPEITQRRSFAFLETCLFALYFASRYAIKEQLRLTAYALGITAIISFFFSLAFPSSALESGVHAGSWRGPFLHKNLFARLMTLICLVNLLVTPVNRREGYLFLAFCCLSFGMIGLSTSKSALFIGIILFLLMQIYQTISWQDYIRIPLWLTGLLLAGSLFLWIGMNLEDIITASGRDLTLSGRTIIWSAVLDKIQERPWLGYGYVGFWYGLKGPSSYVQKAYGTTYIPPHSHNGFLELAIAFGLVGTILFIMSFLLVIRRTIISAIYQSHHEGLWPLMYLSFLILYNQTESTLLEHNSIFWLLYMSLALSPFLPQHNAQLNYEQNSVFSQ